MTHKQVSAIFRLELKRVIQSFLSCRSLNFDFELQDFNSLADTPKNCVIEKTAPPQHAISCVNSGVEFAAKKIRSRLVVRATSNTRATNTNKHLTCESGWRVLGNLEEHFHGVKVGKGWLALCQFDGCDPE